MFEYPHPHPMVLQAHHAQGGTQDVQQQQNHLLNQLGCVRRLVIHSFTFPGGTAAGQAIRHQNNIVFAK